MNNRVLGTRTSDFPRSRIGTVALLAAAGWIGLAGCAPSTVSDRPADVLPGPDSIPGWKSAGEPATYTRKTLFDYMDGASEYYFTYTFEEMAANRYTNNSGAELAVEVWRLAEAQDAFGLYSGRGGTPVTVGGANDASLESGSRLVFWKNRYFVNLSAWESVADGDLYRFAEFISQKLPTGGERPPLTGRLPAEGLVSDSVKFFHMELAVQDQLWLGGENLLGLDMDTDAVLARYRQGESEWQLLLVQYPNSERADAGLQALQSGRVEGAAAADRNESLVGAAFGENGGAAAQTALEEALRK